MQAPVASELSSRALATRVQRYVAGLGSDEQPQRARPLPTESAPAYDHICPVSLPFKRSLPAVVAPRDVRRLCGGSTSARPESLAWSSCSGKQSSPGSPGPWPPPHITAHDCSLLDSCCHWGQEVWSPSRLPSLLCALRLPQRTLLLQTLTRRRAWSCGLKWLMAQ